MPGHSYGASMPASRPRAVSWQTMSEKGVHDKDVQYSWQTPRDRSLRASDRDRRAVGEILRKAHVEGRLDSDEFADRYGHCLQAKTYSELDGLLTDLPLQDVGPVPTPAWPGGSQWAGGTVLPPYGAQQAPAGSNARPPWRHLLVLAPLAWVAVVAAVIEAFALGTGRVLWIVFPLLFFFWVGRRRPRASRHRGGCGTWW